METNGALCAIDLHLWLFMSIGTQMAKFLEFSLHEPIFEPKLETPQPHLPIVHCAQLRLETLK